MLRYKNSRRNSPRVFISYIQENYDKNGRLKRILKSCIEIIKIIRNYF